MQEVFNASWYAGNELLKYPIDSSASGYSDDGAQLPSSLISDIRMVSTQNRVLRISGVTCSEYLISVVISAGNDMIAAVTVPQPVTPFEHYTLEPFSDDVTGVIAFGHTDTYGKWRFSTNDQSKLAQTCQMVLNPWPVTSFYDNLKGDIILSAGAGISIGIEDRLIGETRMSGTSNGGLQHVQAIVIRGNSETSSYTTQEQNDTAYLGKCSTRPDNSSNDSDSKCRYILGIDGATPDCNGNIDIELTSNDPNITVSLSTSATGSVFTDCETTLTNCNTVVITGSQERSYEPMTFGNQGEDLCAEDEEETTTTTTTSSGVSVIPVNLKDDTYPSEGEGLSYSESSGLTNLNDTPAVVSIDRNCVYTKAKFTMVSGGMCGFKWNTNQSFLYNGNMITFNNRTIPLESSASPLTMEMSISDGTLTARLLNGEIILATMDCECEIMTNISLYLYENLCTEWRIG